MSGCTSSAQPTNNQIKPELEQQVLQIIRDNPEVIIESVQAYQQGQQQQKQANQEKYYNSLKIILKNKLVTLQLLVLLLKK